jgi:hypothetical protein
MIGIEVRTKKLEDALFRLSSSARVSYGKVIKEEARYVTQTLIRFTPPASLKEGRGAVSLDFGKLVNPLRFDYFKERETEGGFYRSISRYIRRREHGKLQALFNNPALKGFYGMTLLTNKEQISRHHLQRRTRYGRVHSGAKTHAAFATDAVKVMKDIQSRVGWTVSGWIPAARATGARWKKFSGRFEGKSGSQKSNFGLNPFIIARNFKVKIPNYQKDVDDVLRSRINTTKRKLQRVLAGKAVNLGFVRVKGGQPVSE